MLNLVCIACTSTAVLNLVLIYQVWQKQVLNRLFFPPNLVNYAKFTTVLPVLVLQVYNYTTAMY
eukprot:SAG11_NODE_348_length_10402_cov_8.763467_7_plen_64_part_00